MSSNVAASEKKIFNKLAIYTDTEVNEYGVNVIIIIIV